ncbi:MAG: hypothetical protein Q4C49_11345 [Bacillota bacterium]|nr:hypothetical protein [Bacillota bacterium]
MANSYFTSAFIKPVIQTWLASMECAKDSSSPNRMYISEPLGKKDENGKDLYRMGIIQFYDKSIHQKEAGEFYGDIMELMIYDDFPEVDSIAKYLANHICEPVFYLHFEMYDFEFVMEQLSDFFRFYYDVHKSNGIEGQTYKKDIHRILICCTAGLTSGYFAAMMQEKIDKQLPDYDIEVQSCNVNFLSDYIDTSDLVLITPQISYLEKELKEKYGNKIQAMDRVDFATFNVDHVLETIWNA